VILVFQAAAFAVAGFPNATVDYSPLRPAVAGDSGEGSPNTLNIIDLTGSVSTSLGGGGLVTGGSLGVAP